MNILIERVRNNWKSGLTVSLVSLPLSISLGVAAGATPLMGVITAIWAGFIASLLGGSHYNIVGPTGALSGVLANFALLYGASSLPMLAIMSGVIILIAYILKLEKYISFIPSSAIHGFTLGVAFIIGLNQLNFALGLQGLPVHEKFVMNVWESLHHIASADIVAVGVFLIGLVFLLLWSKRFPTIPAPVLLAAVGIVSSYTIHALRSETTLQTLYSKFGSMPGALWQMPHISYDLITKESVIAAITIAVIAILETLISAKIADNMTKTKHRQRPEVFGLGIANIVSGVFGGIPATAALARTALNVKSGANHTASSTINSVFVAIITLVCFSWFQYLPLSIVAAILVYVAIRMVSIEHFAHLYRYDKVAFFTSLVVAGITVIQDPIVGILVGAVVSLLIVIHNMSRMGGEVTVNRGKSMVGRYHSSDLPAMQDHGDIIVYRFSGELTYINAQTHLAATCHINGGTNAVVLSFRNLYYVDVDGLDVLQEIIETLEKKGKLVCISGMNVVVLSLIEKTGWFKRLQQEERVFDSSYSAIECLHVMPGICAPLDTAHTS